ncbi:MAG: cellulase family glycosylhydrolase [Planctomycetales bacterium]|nr:cellulase family glycosylhydrolase [Planctomycetales bacterium]
MTSALRSARICLVAIALAIPCAPISAAEPLSLHRDNPHYFLFRGKPTILITSAEHYGAVLNPDFGYVKYLDELAAHGLNNTRTFSGAYVEPQGAFNIAKNTLAPDGKKFLCPWARSDQPGYAGGGNKFDLTKWDEAYFKRLKDFVTQAGKRGIVVEMNLFCPMYEDQQWKLSPQKEANNVNGVGKVGRNDVHTLDKNGGLLAIQEKMVRKFVAELAEFDNVYYEVCNEPYFGGVTMDWQHHIVETIVEAEKGLPAKHLISLNIANGSKKIEKPHPSVSIFNFHYASPPSAVAENFSLNKVIGDNETGFKGTADDHYRMEAWEFLLAGGGLYNNLDYSFVAGQEDGTFDYPKTQPGGGSRKFREQMKVLKDFLYGFDFVRMKPNPAIVKSKLPKDTHCQVLAESGKQYALYFHGSPGEEVTLELPQGEFAAEWINVTSGKTIRQFSPESAGPETKIPVPPNQGELALRIHRR